MVKNIIFDFDGVILDSFQDQFNWFKYITSFLNKDFPYKSIEKFRQDYEEPVYPNMYTKLGFDWDKEKGIIWEEYNKHKAKNNIPLCEDIDEVIAELFFKRYDLAIASSNTFEAIDKQIDYHILWPYINVITSKDDLGLYENKEPKLKPHPECLLQTLDKLKCKVEDCVYIGDQPSDILAARNVKEYLGKSMKIISVGYGFSPKEKLMELKPDYYVDTAYDLTSIISKM